MSASPLSRAWQALGHLLGEKLALPEIFDADLVADAARVHRLEGALAEPRLARIPEAVPSRLRDRWQAAHAAGVAQAVRRSAPLAAALEALEPIPAIVLKGAALAELVYPSPGARGMGDVDLLVHPHDLEAALSRLEAAGYRRKYPRHPVLDAPAFHERQLEGPLELDLHQGFIQRPRLAVDYRAVFDRALPWTALGANAWLLSPEDAVVYSCVHAAIGEFTPSWAPAIGLLDLREMLRPRPAFWKDVGPALDLSLIVSRAREWGAERMLYCAMELARRVFPSVAADFGPVVSAPTRRILDAAIIHRASPPALVDPSRVEVLLRKGLLLRPSARLRFGTSTLWERLK